MGILDTVFRGFSLIRASFNVAVKEPWMFLLPIISGALILGILAILIVIPLIGGLGINPVYAAIAIGCVYFVGYFLAYFTQAMIVFGARERFGGRDPAFLGALSKALQHLPGVLALSIIGAIIGMMANALSNSGRGSRNPVSGIALSLLSGLLGAGWTVISYFSLPVMLNEDTDILNSFKRSAEIVAKVWGEGVSANLSMGLIYLPALAFFLAGIIFLPLMAPALLWFIGAFVVSIPVRGVMSQALYHYASTGTVPTGFEANSLYSAFSKK